MPLKSFRKKPARPLVPELHARARRTHFDFDFMGAFHEEALDLIDAREARDRSEEPRHG